MKGASVLVTGAHGFLGKHILNLLLEEGCNIVGLCKQIELNTEIPSQIKLYHNTQDLFRNEKKFELIFHLAAYVPYGNFEKPDDQFYTTNIKLTSELVSNYPSSRFIFSSSVSVYGIPLSLPLAVHSPFNRPDLYGLSKIAGEAIITTGCSSYAIIRFSSIVGKGMKSTSFVPKIIERAKQNGIISLLGDGSRQQNYIDVLDAALLCMLVAKQKENMVLLGIGKRSYNNREIAEFIANVTGSTIEYKGSDESPSFIYNHTKTSTGFLFTPTLSLHETLDQMLK